MSTILYVLDEQHFDAIAAHLPLVSTPPESPRWCTGIGPECPLYDFLDKHLERIEHDQPIDCEKVIAPAGKMLMGVTCAWRDDGEFKSMDCDLFAPHKEYETPLRSIIGQMYGLANYLVAPALRPKKTTALGWQLMTEEEGYRVLRLRGLHE